MTRVIYPIQFYLEFRDNGLGVDSWCWGSAESEHPRQINHEIIFEVFQLMWPRYLNVTDRRTDDFPWQYRALCVALHGKTETYRLLFQSPGRIVLFIYRPDWPSVETLAEDAADVRFRRVLRNENHLLYTLLLDKNSHGYNLRHRRHDRTLVSNHNQRNFIDRQLQKHSY